MHDRGMVRFTGPFFPNPLVDTAKALWDNLWDMTAINEQAFPDEPNLRHILQYGNWDVRAEKALELLRSFYKLYFGDEGTALLEKFMQTRSSWQRRSLGSTCDTDPRLVRQPLSSKRRKRNSTNCSTAFASPIARSKSPKDTSPSARPTRSSTKWAPVRPGFFLSGSDQLTYSISLIDNNYGS